MRRLVRNPPFGLMNNEYVYFQYDEALEMITIGYDDGGQWISIAVKAGHRRR